MDVTNDQIKEEFKRQVHLCAGIGEREMLAIIRNYFNPPRITCYHPKEYRIYNKNRYSNECTLCGSLID